jgi:4-hydroxy-3-methylbut-2-enyl diphosphate reductase
VVLVGHRDHDEIEGTLGEGDAGGDGAIQLVENVDGVHNVHVPDPNRVAYLTQTTLAPDETAEVIDRLRDRFPALVGPASDDICYATQNRQEALRAVARQCDLVLVIGSGNSSNSNRLVEVAEREGCSARLIDDETDIRLDWLRRARRVGITAGASAPESLVHRVVDALASFGPVEVSEQTSTTESVQFALPMEVR